MKIFRTVRDLKEAWDNRVYLTPNNDKTPTARITVTSNEHTATVEVAVPKRRSR